MSIAMELYDDFLEVGFTDPQARRLSDLQDYWEQSAIRKVAVISDNIGLVKRDLEDIKRHIVDIKVSLAHLDAKLDGKFESVDSKFRIFMWVISGLFAVMGVGFGWVINLLMSLPRGV